MRILTGAIRGAATGAGIAVIMILLDQLGPFSVPVNSFIDRAIFRLCPFYALGFSKDVPNKAAWFLITIAGNAVVYGALFALIALAIGVFHRKSPAGR
jgi:hypothetical protein